MSKKKKFRREEFKKSANQDQSQSFMSKQSKLDLDTEKNSIKETKLSLFCLKAIEYLWLAVLILVPLVFWVNFSIVIIKSAVFESLVLLMLLFWIIRAIEIKKIEFKINFITILLGLFLLGVILSTIFSLDPPLSFWGSAARAEGLKAFIGYILFFFIIASTLKTERQIQRIFTALIWVSLPISIYGILQYFRISLFTMPYQFLFPGEKYRAFATFGNPVFLAGWLVIVIPITFYRISQLWNYYKSGFKKYLKYIYILILISQIAALFLTLTRGAIIAFGLSLFLTFILIAVLKKIRWLWISALAVFILFSISLVSLNTSSNFLHIPKDTVITSRFSNILAEGSSFYARLITWKSLFKPIKDHLLLGVGPDAYDSFSLSKEYFQPEMLKLGISESRTDRAHNIILDSLLAFGIFTTIVFFVLLGCIFFCLIKKIFQSSADYPEKYLFLALFIALFAFFIQGLVSFSETILGSLLFLLIAIVYFLSTFQLAQESETDQRLQYKKARVKSNPFWIYILPALIIGAIFYGFVLRPLSTEAGFQKGLSLTKKKETKEQGEKLIERARQNNPWNYRYCIELINAVAADSTEENLKEAEAILTKARADRPEEVTYPFLLARVYSVWGNHDLAKFASAEEILKESLEYYGYKIVFYQEYIRELVSRKEFDRAEEMIKKAIDYSDYQEANYYLGAAEGAMQKEEYDQAIKYLEATEKGGGLEVTNQRYWLLGIAYYQKKDYGQASENWEKCFEVNPRDTNCLRSLIINYREQGQYDQALEYSEKMIRISPKLGEKLKREIEQAKLGQ